MADSDKSNKNTKLIAILALVIALATAAIAVFDGDSSTNPDIPAVIDAGTDVYDEFRGNNDSDDAVTEPEG